MQQKCRRNQHVRDKCRLACGLCTTPPSPPMLPASPTPPSPPFHPPPSSSPPALPRPPPAFPSPPPAPPLSPSTPPPAPPPCINKKSVSWCLERVAAGETCDKTDTTRTKCNAFCGVCKAVTPPPPPLGIPPPSPPELPCKNFKSLEFCVSNTAISPSLATAAAAATLTAAPASARGAATGVPVTRVPPGNPCGASGGPAPAPRVHASLAATTCQPTSVPTTTSAAPYTVPIAPSALVCPGRQDQPQLCGGRHMSTGRRPTGPASRPAQSDGRPARLHLSPDLRLKRPRIGDAAGGLGPREWHRSRAGHQVGG